MHTFNGKQCLFTIEVFSMKPKLIRQSYHHLNFDTQLKSCHTHQRLQIICTLQRLTSQIIERLQFITYCSKKVHKELAFSFRTQTAYMIYRRSYVPVQLEILAVLDRNLRRYQQIAKL
ncbi:Hypothetical_protein [Hexamita inflata]|uniref:Hypothetical_protein n=1 Tax=Hexamita inflata TaxID=28002 RepID=A0AA86UQP7_9EUKA|nr:Hypothetical protein HINF_LOCUS48617 [Hexamita inflata]CAI9960973.1 Hypothetical protein HINF_LOCUS48618 [Hexamita inflata]CAI9960974.1 Hypothetical protein HINF_LOCUS48619 [Hexamita inflata]